MLRRPVRKGRRTRPLYVRDPDLGNQDMLRADRHSQKLDLHDLFALALIYPTATKKAARAFKDKWKATLPEGMEHVCWVMRDKPRTTRARLIAAPLAALNALREVAPAPAQNKHAFNRVARFLDALINDQHGLRHSGELDPGNPLQSDGDPEA